MSRSTIRSWLKIPTPLLIASFALSGCGSGSGGSADTGGGGSVPAPAPPVTITETFDFSAPAGYFVVGDPPLHARFSGGVAQNNGAWIVQDGATAVIDFATPADTVTFSTQDNYTAAAAVAGGVQKPTGPAASQAVSAPFDTPMYLRGLNEDWGTAPARRFQADAALDNVLVLSLDLGPTIVDDTFKVADAGWTAGTDCGKSSVDAISVGAPFPLDCGGGVGKDILLTIPEQAKWKFTLDVRDAANPTLTLAKDTGDGGGGGGGEEPENSTEIRVYGVDTLTAGAQPALLTSFTDKGTISVAEVAERTGGSPRITRIEIENLGTAGDIGIEYYTRIADARFAPDKTQTDIVYRRQVAGETTGTTIEVGTVTYDCVPDPSSAFSCIVRDVPVYPYANEYMTVTNADGSTEDIQFNAGQGGDLDDANPGEVVFAVSGGPIARSGLPGEAGIGTALPANTNEVILFYKRADNNYDGALSPSPTSCGPWGLHLFPTDPPGDSWTQYSAPYPYEGVDPQRGAGHVHDAAEGHDPQRGFGAGQRLRHLPDRAVAAGRDHQPAAGTHGRTG